MHAENISIGFQNRSGRQKHECRIAGAYAPALRAGIQGRFHARMCAAFTAQRLRFPLPLKTRRLRASSGQRKYFLSQTRMAELFAKRLHKQKLPSEAFVCAAEHVDFCLGRPPKIGARREAAQTVLSFSVNRQTNWRMLKSRPYVSSSHSHHRQKCFHGPRQ